MKNWTIPQAIIAAAGILTLGCLLVVLALGVGGNAILTRVVPAADPQNTPAPQQPFVAGGESMTQTYENYKAQGLLSASTPVNSDLQTGCMGAWNTAAKATNILVPGHSARGDVEVNGVKHYDNGSGEGTTIINNSRVSIQVYAEWGSGCESTTDVKTLVNKDLSVGCGDNNGDGVGDGCKVARIVTYTGTTSGSLTFTTEYYTEPIK